MGMRAQYAGHGRIADGGAYVTGDLSVGVEGNTALLYLRGWCENSLSISPVSATVEAKLLDPSGAVVSQMRADLETNPAKGLPWLPPTGRGGEAKLELDLSNRPLNVQQVEFTFFDRAAPSPVVDLINNAAPLILAVATA